MRTLFGSILLTITMLGSFESYAQNGQHSDPDQEFRAYCENKLRILERSKSQASMAIANGQFLKGLDILLGGLEQMSGQQFGDLLPMSSRLISHTLRLGLKLKYVASGNEKGIKASIVALESFYDLIFQTVQDIDYRYYRCSGWRFGCRYPRSLEFEQDMLSLVRGMLMRVNSSLALSRNWEIYPLGPTSAYLNAAEVIAGASYNELGELVYSNAYACEILDLKDIMVDLRIFNQSNQSAVASRQKFYETYNNFERVINTLGNRYRCR